MTTQQDRSHYLISLMTGLLLLGGCASPEDSALTTKHDAQVELGDAVPSSTAEQLVAPQPFKPTCAICNVGVDVYTGGTDALYMTIGAQKWKMDMIVTQAILYVTDSSDNVTTYTLTSDVVDQINLMDDTQVIEVQFNHPDPMGATLEFKYESLDGGYTTSSTTELWVWYP